MPKTTPRTRSPKSAKRKRPQGRDEVRLAIIAAAEMLFAERGYAGVSIRDIAAEANVNHGLVHRHFGSKELLLRDVLLAMFSDVGAAARSALDVSGVSFIPDLFAAAAKRRKHWIILMRAVLDGYDFDEVGFTFPITGAVVEHIALRRGIKDDQTKIIAGAVIAGGIGWLLLEDYLSSAIGLPHDRVEQMRKAMAELYAELIDKRRT